VAKTKGKAAKREGLIDRIVRYLKETRAEIRKVTWPTRQEAINLTGIVLAVTVFMATLLALLDLLFSKVFVLIIG